MIRKLMNIAAAFLFTGLLSLGAVAVMAMSAEAGVASEKCYRLSQTACEAAKRAAARDPYTGPIRQSNVPMACARVVSYGPTEVVWVAGSKRNYKTAPVIRATPVVYTETFSLNGGWTVTESCIPRSALDGVKDVTLCNHKTGRDRGFHWSLTRPELGGMKRSGHFTSYVPFLTVSDRKSLTKWKVTAAYKARYF